MFLPILIIIININPNSNPKGILLYGPQGCGKSALAKALAKSGNIPMLSISPSLLLRKYVGETSQLTRAIFSLAFKIQPCILFIDEMDSLFRERFDDDNVVHRNLKTEFMCFWDQITSSKSLITVIGATNRPQELDSAVQRRFERSYLIGILLLLLSIYHNYNHFYIKVFLYNRNLLLVCHYNFFNF